MNIGSTIQKKRKALGFTQKELAEKLHVSFQAVSKWEKDQACPEIEILPALAQILETTVDALVGFRSPIMADYEVSNLSYAENVAKMWEKVSPFGEDDEVTARICGVLAGVHYSMMDLAWKYMKETWGSPEEYLCTVVLFSGISTYSK